MRCFHHAYSTLNSLASPSNTSRSPGDEPNVQQAPRTFESLVRDAFNKCPFSRVDQIVGKSFPTPIAAVHRRARSFALLWTWSSPLSGHKVDALIYPCALI